MRLSSGSVHRPGRPAWPCYRWLRIFDAWFLPVRPYPIFYLSLNGSGEALALTGQKSNNSHPVQAAPTVRLLNKVIDRRKIYLSRKYLDWGPAAGGRTENRRFIRKRGGQVGRRVLYKLVGCAVGLVRHSGTVCPSVNKTSVRKTSGRTYSNCDLKVWKASLRVSISPRSCRTSVAICWSCSAMAGDSGTEGAVDAGSIVSGTPPPSIWA